MNFENLPNYVKFSIIEFLEPQEIFKMSKVGKSISDLINKNEPIVWSIIYNNSKNNPKIVVSSKNNYNFQFNNYTFSISSTKFDLKQKYKIAKSSHQNYLLKSN